jgi:hypothetical protein
MNSRNTCACNLQAGVGLCWSGVSAVAGCFDCWPYMGQPWMMHEGKHAEHQKSTSVTNHPWFLGLVALLACRHRIMIHFLFITNLCTLTLVVDY